MSVSVSTQTEVWPLTIRQEAQLLAYELAEHTPIARFESHFPIAVHIRGELDLAALEIALNRVIHRHGGLTARYIAGDTGDGIQRRMVLDLFARTKTFRPGLYVQRMEPEAIATIRHRTLDTVPPGGLTELAEHEAFEPLIMNEAPVMRATAFSLTPVNHLLVLTVSHLAVDGWSAGIIREELHASYASLTTGRPLNLPVVQHHAGDFAARERERLRQGYFNDHVVYWRHYWMQAAGNMVRHEDIPAAIKVLRAHDGRVKVCRESLSVETSLNVRQLAAFRITPYVFFRTTFTLLLYRYTGRRRLAFFANFANRRDEAFQRSIVSSVHPHIVSSEVEPLSTLLDHCHAMAAALADAQSHEEIAEAGLQLLGVTGIPRTDARVTFDMWPPVRRSVTDVMEPVLVPGGRRWIDLDVRSRDEGDRFVLYASFNERRYSADGIHMMLSELVQLASAVTAFPERPVTEVIECCA
jgi:hypothetical protein